MKQRCLLSIFCFFLISFGVGSVSAQVCMEDKGNFIPNSTFDINRRSLISSLPSKVIAEDNFYYNGFIGEEPNRVYTVGMCSPESTLNDCYDCIKTASDQFLQNCPNQTEAYTWPGNPVCYARYSDISFVGSVDLTSRYLLIIAGKITSDLTEFRKLWEEFMRRMIDAVSTESSPSSTSNHYKADLAALTPIQNIYALMQCTPDLSSGQCELCLQRNAADFQSCCSDGLNTGGIVARPSCFLRWDLSPFSKVFDDIKMASPPPQPPVTVPQPAGHQANTTRNSNGIWKARKGGNSSRLVVATVVPIVVVGLLFIAGYCFLAKRRKKNCDTAPAFDGDDITTADSLQLDYRTIKTATNDFAVSNKIGQGGFGEVYKGTLLDGTKVAVKTLSKSSGQGEAEFKNEVVLVAKLQHRNLVKLFGFCLYGEERVLVYEYVPNESLDYFLFDPKKQGKLDWTRRYKIIVGIARGILYLHQDSRLTIIHRDLKASNILLDEDMNPKIADFGMARIFGLDQSVENTSRIVGTFGYMSPEYAMHGQYSMKSDVYSFGVLVLEVISGRKNNSFHQTDGAHDLVSYAWRLWSNGTPLELIDPSTADTCQKNEVVRCVHIGLLCVQDDIAERPTLSAIILMLTSNTVTLPVPQQPGLFFQNRSLKDPLYTDTTSKSLPGSVGDASITDLYSR